jgi:hypothetical protein
MTTSGNTSPRLLFALLDWGLGHATRTAPLIAFAAEQGWDVHVASHGTALAFLQSNCAHPKVSFHEKPNQSISYAKRGNAIKIAWQIPGFLRNISREQKWTEAFVAQHGITHILSDNCYGVHSSQASSILLSHQWHLPVGWLLGMFARIFVRRQARPFDALWTPDRIVNPGFSGRLGSSSHMPTIERIGVLSRLPKDAKPGPWKRVGMVSGLEPHRQLMEDALRRWMEHDGQGGLIIAGRPGGTVQIDGSITTWPNPSADELASALQGAEQIVCRSGYSSLLDLAALNVIAVLVPTPGQAEQAYLAKHWAASFGFATCSQSQLEAGHIPKVQGELAGETANERAFQMLLHWVTPSQK